MDKILVIDNYDSFTYNLVQYIQKITGVSPAVFRNDEISLDEAGGYDKILLSPGPGVPVEAGICIELIKRYSPSKSILGICLGHQAVGEAFGGKIINLSTVFHGIATPITITDPDEYLLRNLPSVFTGGRYHSWVVSTSNLPPSLKVICEDENGIIMGISHREYDVRGLQFHPESILTQYGIEILTNWINK